MFLMHIFHMPEPIVGEAYTLVAERGMHARAAIVTTDNDVLYLEKIDGKLQHRKAIKVGVDHDIGDIAMNKEFPGQKANDGIRRHTTVSTANPQKLWGLL
jgi:hypothetical protein